ncbi:hypothetical protein AVEN_181243-1 [Araneus ventricosus]|uniref:DDE-1 domain-containing protein n=1 Tax=Araneus ventricosus TaxID=182803 RepID=A0A4Y2K682_ARAVE|nr:hypothetical protein AVEN_181243-1 [Araneus ventricosus]
MGEDLPSTFNLLAVSEKVSSTSDVPTVRCHAFFRTHFWDEVKELMCTVPCRRDAHYSNIFRSSGGLDRLPACPMASVPLKHKLIWAPRICVCEREGKPSHQGVLENLKRNSRKKLLGQLIEDLEERRVAECLKEIRLKDAVYWITEAWEGIESTTLQKSWEGGNFPSEQPNDENEASDDKSLLSLAETLPVSETLTEKDIDEWMNREKLQMTRSQIWLKIALKRALMMKTMLSKRKLRILTFSNEEFYSLFLNYKHRTARRPLPPYP